MSSAPRIRTRIATAVTVLGLAVASYSLTPLGAAMAATKPVSIKGAETSVVNTINSLRGVQTKPLPALLSNGFVDEYAAAWVQAYAACKGCSNPSVAEPADVITLPAWADTHPVLTSVSGTVASALQTFRDDVGTLPRNEATHGPFADNYGAVAITTKHGRVYEVILFVQADSIPGRIFAPVPTITGKTAVGSTLTAHAGDVAPSGTTVGFTWERGDGVIVLRNSDTYVPTADDLGETFFVFDAVSKDGYKSASTASKTTAKTGLGTIVPGKVTIHGHANLSSQGFLTQELTALRGDWSPVAPTFTYQWYANGHPIAGAAEQTFGLPTSGDIKGKRITVKVTASEDGYKTAHRTSAATAPVGPPLIPNVYQPTIAGSATIGSTLTASNGGDWGPGTVSQSWKWTIDGKVVRGATKNRFVVPASAFAKSNEQIAVIETGKARSYAATSSTSDTFLATPRVFTGNESVWVETTTPGHTLRVTFGDLTPKATVIKYQWYKDDLPLHGATKSSLKTSKKSGHVYYVLVTRSRPGYNSFSMYSNTVFVNPKEFTESGVATLIVAKSGHSLSVRVTGFVPSPDRYTYQWYKDGVAIPKATKSTLATSKLGHEYFVIVTGHRADYYADTTISNTVTVGEN